MVKGFPVVLSDRGAPFVAVEKNAPLATVAENGRGLPIRLVEKGAPPIILQGGAPWTPLDLFADGTDGTLWEPWDISTLFQDNTGTTPVTAGGDPVRLVLDKSRGLELGPELYTGQNASSVSNAGGGAVFTWDDITRTLAITSAGSSTGYPRITYTPGIIAGKFYKVYGRIVSDGVALNLVRLDSSGSSYNIPYNPTTGVFEAQMASGSDQIQFVVNGTSTGTIRIAELSIREIATVPLSQSVLANAFTAVNSGSVWSIVSDYAGDVLSATLPFAIDGEILIAGTGGTIIEPVSYASGSTFNLGTDTYTGGTPGILRAIGPIVGVVLLDRAFTEDEKTQLIDYYKGKGAKGQLVEGPELVTNGDFSNGETGWGRNTQWDILPGEARRSGTNTGGSIGQTGWQVQSGRTYLTKWRRLDEAFTSDTIRLNVKTGFPPPAGGDSFMTSYINTLGEIERIVQPSVNGYFSLYCYSSSTDIRLTDVSVRELRAQEDWL